LHDHLHEFLARKLSFDHEPYSADEVSCFWTI
jgi:hypothetical protein